MEHIRIPVTKARSRFAEIISDAKYGLVSILTRHGKDIAAVVPVSLLAAAQERPSNPPVIAPTQKKTRKRKR